MSLDRLEREHRDPELRRRDAQIHAQPVVLDQRPRPRRARLRARQGRCRGFEINQKHGEPAAHRHVIFDILGFHRETQTAGGASTALILLRDDVVVYKLTGGQPAIQQTEENQTRSAPGARRSQQDTGISFLILPGVCNRASAFIRSTLNASRAWRLRRRRAGIVRGALGIEHLEVRRIPRTR